MRGGNTRSPAESSGRGVEEGGGKIEERGGGGGAVERGSGEGGNSHSLCMLNLREGGRE